MSQHTVCPMCGDVLLYSDYSRFGMCLDCYADSIASNVTESILYDFLRDYGLEFREYIDSAYDYDGD